MPRSIVRPLLAATLAVLAALALAGCGGGGGGGADISTGLTPQQILDKSSEAAAALESFQIAIDGTGQVDLAQGAAVPGASFLNGPIAVSGEGPVQPPDRASFDAKLTLSGLSPQVNLTRVGNDVFVGILGQDFRLALPPAQVALFDFGQLYPTLARWMKDPVEAGREEIDGTPTVKITGGIDAVAAFTDLGPLLQTQSSATAASKKALQDAVKTGTVEAWIGTEDLRPRRVHIVLKAGGLSGAIPVKAIDIDLTATFSGFGEPVDIQAPANARELDPAQLGALTGG